MPRFFDSSALNEQESQHWDYAIDTYERLRADAGDMAIFWNPPGHEKSALFARLLNGKSPLPSPPPTRFAYPWYEVVEEQADHHCFVGFHGRQAIVYQCAYQIVDMNPAAKALRSFYVRHMRQSEKGNRRLRRQLYALIERDPRFILRYGDYEFLLSYNGKSQIRTRRQYLTGKYRLDMGLSGGYPVIENVIPATPRSTLKADPNSGYERLFAELDSDNTPEQVTAAMDALDVAVRGFSLRLVQVSHEPGTV